MEDSNFSYDVLSQILSFLPAKSIAKLRATNKYLTSNYIHNDHFFFLQSKNSKTDSGFFITNPGTSKIFFIEPHAGIPQESIKLLEKTPNILTSSNGLTFCKKEKNVGSEKNIYAYNLVHKTRCVIPSTLAEENLGEIPFLGLSVVYCRDSLDTYKLVYLIRNNKDWSDLAYVRLYDSEKNSWMDVEIDLGPRNIEFESSVVIGDNVFWVSDCGAYMKKSKPYIVAFNVKSCNSRFISLPEGVLISVVERDEENDVRIAKKDDESLCLVNFCKSVGEFTVFTMEIDSAAPKWRIVNTISLAEMRLEKKKRIISSFGLLKGDEILVFTMGFKAVYAYNFKDKRVKKIGETASGYASLIPYANTLRPCGKYESMEAY